MLGKIAVEKASKDNKNVGKFFSNWQQKGYDSEPQPRMTYLKNK